MHKFDNPMQGIFGAHLMLLARDRASSSTRLWPRVMSRTMTAPFLSWAVVTDSARAELQDSMREVIETREKIRNRPRSSRRRAQPAEDFALESLQPAPTEDYRRKVSLDLDMPRVAVEKILGGT